MSGLDQYYTKQNVAKFCVEKFNELVENINDYGNVIEPSAGCGNILQYLPNHTVALDLEPKSDNIQYGDYLLFQPNLKSGKVLVFGNPPYGKNSNLAISFFNHSATFADTIAFIVPRTFRKPAVINRLNKKFHLINEIVLPIDSFITPDNKSYSVPTTFQIWQKKNINREQITLSSILHDWVWTKDKNLATHAIRRVGGKAGYIYSNPKETSEPSHYYIISNVENISDNWNKVYQHFWKEENELNPKWDVAGNPSLTMGEMTYYYNLLIHKTP
jgi:hypothetical protein